MSLDTEFLGAASDALPKKSVKVSCTVFVVAAFLTFTVLIGGVAPTMASGRTSTVALGVRVTKAFGYRTPRASYRTQLRRDAVPCRGMQDYRIRPSPLSRSAMTILGTRTRGKQVRDVSGRAKEGLDLQQSFDGRGLRIGIVKARWNSEVTNALAAGCTEALKSCNVTDITVENVAGAYEVPCAAQQLIESKKFDAVVCIGCLVKGETMHFEYISEAVTQGIMRVNLDYRTPVIFGILSVMNEEQAKQRAGLTSTGHNHGTDWGITAVESCLLQKKYNPKEPTFKGFS